MPAANIIQSLWIGPELSTMERLAICSFLHHGHRFHLYTYDSVRNVPPGTELKGANEVISAERIFRYPDTGSYAGFSNFFRYRLLLERGNWWTDLDMVCLRPFDLAGPAVRASERAGGGCRYVTTGVLGFEPGHPAMAIASKICDLRNPRTIVHGETGPALMEWLVRKLSLETSVVEPEVFCPVPCHRFESLTRDEVTIHQDAYSVHLWNELWMRTGLDRNGQYSSGCLYGTLKSRYL